MTFLITLVMLVLFIKGAGLLLRAGWEVSKWIFGLIGGLIAAVLVISVAGVFLLPLIAVIALVVAAFRALLRR